MAEVIYKERFVWASEKNDANKVKHEGISFELATEVFEDPYAVEIFDEDHSTIDEDRYSYIGSTAIGVINGQCLSVSITYRDDLIRIISAREADPEEKRRYYGTFSEFAGK
jgi:uncharacterized DUF497 family protein